MSTTVVYDTSFAPKVTLTKDDAGGFTAVIEVEGLDPQRGTSADERAMGITSLDPPTVTVSARASAYSTHRALIDASWRAVSASATSTLGGDTGGPAGLICTCLRVTAAVRHALRLLEEEI